MYCSQHANRFSHFLHIDRLLFRDIMESENETTRKHRADDFTFRDARSYARSPNHTNRRVNPGLSRL